MCCLALYKVNLAAISIVSALVTRFPDKFAPFIDMVMSELRERLGDNREEVWH